MLPPPSLPTPTTMQKDVLSPPPNSGSLFTQFTEDGEYVEYGVPTLSDPLPIRSQGPARKQRSRARLNPQVVPRLPCSFPGCLKTLSTLRILGRHEDNHYNQERDWCACGKGLSRLDSLVRHVKKLNEKLARQDREQIHRVLDPTPRKPRAGLSRVFGVSEQSGVSRFPETPTQGALPLALAPCNLEAGSNSSLPLAGLSEARVNFLGFGASSAPHRKPHARSARPQYQPYAIPPPRRKMMPAVAVGPHGNQYVWMPASAPSWPSPVPNFQTTVQIEGPSVHDLSWYENMVTIDQSHANTSGAALTSPAPHVLAWEYPQHRASPVAPVVPLDPQMFSPLQQNEGGYFTEGQLPLHNLPFSVAPHVRGSGDVASFESLRSMSVPQPLLADDLPGITLSDLTTEHAAGLTTDISADEEYTPQLPILGRRDDLFTLLPVDDAVGLAATTVEGEGEQSLADPEHSEQPDDLFGDLFVDDAVGSVAWIAGDEDQFAVDPKLSAFDFMQYFSIEDASLEGAIR